MNHEAINKAISTWFIPPEFWVMHCRRCHCMFRIDGEGCRPDGYCSFIGELPKQVDYFTDEAANARLLEAMKPKEPSLTWNADVGRWELTLLKAHDWIDAETISEHSDRKTAVVLAFCKFAGIEIKDETTR